MKKSLKTRVYATALSALFTAVIAVIAQISFPTPIGIPITLTAFAVCYCGYTLGEKWGVLSVITYILLGFLGLPVFSFFRGGAGVLMEQTGGYIIGYVPLSFFCGISRRKNSKQMALIFGLSGLVLCHIIGSFYLSFISHTNFITAFCVWSLPFLIKDILLLIAAYFLFLTTNKIIGADF